MAEELALELGPVTSGNDRDEPNFEQIGEKQSHVAVNGLLACGQCSVEIENDKVFDRFHDSRLSQLLVGGADVTCTHFHGEPFNSAMTAISGCPGL